MPLSPLPIDLVLPALVAALRSNNSAVLRAPTGAGKTTRVPPALLDAGLANAGAILLLEPRRLAARAAARRMADERGAPLGEEIGYHVRFDRRAGQRTQILVVTPGILLRYLHDDPFLESTAIVVFDEFHERGLESDLALGMVRLVQQTVRPELKLLAMSATLAVEAVSQYLGGCPVITSEGRLHPVEIVYEPRPSGQPWPAAAAAGVARLLERTPGDILVFLPGLQEIRQTGHHLETLAGEQGLAVLPLHGDLPPEQQDAALLPRAERRIVLATNVAETSVTVEGVTGVVDTGLARQMVFDPAVGLDRLELTPISRSSADQRTGRAGRTQPGLCIRLWSQGAERGRPEVTEPEIARVDLAGAVLQLLALGESDLDRFPWIDPPPAAALDRARQLLQRLGAMDENGITELGRSLARLPVHPRLGRLLLESHRWGQPERGALLAAFLAERDPFPRSLDRPAENFSPTRSDLLDRIEALETFDRQGHYSGPLGTLARGAVRFLFHARDQLLRSLRQKARGMRVEPIDPDEAILRALLAAFPDRLARRREPGGRRGVMVGGRGVRLAPTSGVLDSELFLCVNVDAGGGESLVRLASTVQRDWLPADRITTTVEAEFDSQAEKVVGRRRIRFEDLILEESSAGLPPEAAAVLTEATLTRLDRVLPPEDSPAGMFLLRLRCLQTWLPDLQLPRLEAEDLRDALTSLCFNCRSFADLRSADWLSVLHGRLTHSQRQIVEREAPERLPVPSGSQITLKYELGRAPVLAVRIQELFGLAETPRIAAGRVPVLLHLLAPNYRPQQVTDDLASFWANIYPQVRKELRARYPRHAWPEDPWSAPPESRPKRRRPD